MVGEIKNSNDRILAESVIVLREVVEHLSTARWFLEGPWRAEASVVAASAHLRLAIEKIALVSFIGHGSLTGDLFARTSVAKMSDVFKKLKRINPEFWPVPIRIEQRRGEPQQKRIVYLDESFTQDAALKAWGLLSSHLHAYGRLRPPASADAVLLEIASIGQEMQGLMESFEVSHSANGLALIGRIGAGRAPNLMWIKYSDPQGSDPVTSRIVNDVQMVTGESLFVSNQQSHDI